MSGYGIRKNRYEVFVNVCRLTFHSLSVMGTGEALQIESLLRQDMLETCSDNSFTTYLRNLSIIAKGSKVLLYNGKEKANQAAAFAVVDMEIGNRDLQQCADAVIRLRAEYLWKHKRYTDIKFNFTSGFTAEYKKWAEGNRIKVSGNQVQWYASGKGVDYSYKTFRNYLDMVFYVCRNCLFIS